MARRFVHIVAAFALVAGVFATQPAPAAAACWWSAQTSSSSNYLYFSGGWTRDIVYYRFGYTCNDQPVEIKVERIWHAVNITDSLGVSEHQMADQEIRQVDWQAAISHNHTSCPCWTGTGYRTENAYPSPNVLQYSNNVVAYLYCWKCAEDFYAVSYCHYFRQGGKIVQGGYC